MAGGFAIKSSIQDYTVDGQHHGNSLHQQNGWSIPSASKPGIRDMAMVPTKANISQGPTHPGNTEYFGGHRVQGRQGFNRLEVRPNSLCLSQHSLGILGNRPICYPTNKSITQVRHLATRPSRCFFSGLVSSKWLYISPIQPGGAVPIPSKSTKCPIIVSSSSSVRNRALVPPAVRVECRLPMPPTIIPSLTFD